MKGLLIAILVVLVLIYGTLANLEERMKNNDKQ